MNGRRAWFCLSVGIIAVGIVGAQALAASEDPREVKGRTLFAQGDYQPALELFAALYAENRDPIYLRNIGRCHQKLRHPVKAIDAFEEYLRRSPRLKPAERQEIEAFIKDMKELKASQEASAADTTRPPPDSGKSAGTGAAQSTVAVRPLPPPRPPRTDPVVIDKPGDKPAESKPLTSQWWFWAGVGGAVALSVVATVLIVRAGGVQRPDCETGRTCTP